MKIRYWFFNRLWEFAYKHHYKSLLLYASVKLLDYVPDLKRDANDETVRK